MAKGDGFSKNPKLKLNPAQAKAMMDKFFSSPKAGAAKKTLSSVGGVTKAAAKSIPKPSLNALDLAGGVAKLAEQKDRLHEQRKKSPVKRPKTRT